MIERSCLENCPEIHKIQLRGLGEIAERGWNNGAHAAVFDAADEIVALADSCPGVCSETRVVGVRIPRVHGLLAIPEPVLGNKTVCQSPNLGR